MKNIFLILTVFLFSGCATDNWCHPKKAAADSEKDVLECEYEANKYTQMDFNSGLLGVAIIMDRRKVLKGQCLSLKGFAPCPEVVAKENSKASE